MLKFLDTCVDKCSWMLSVSVCFAKVKVTLLKKQKIGAVNSVPPLEAVTDPCCVDKCL